MLNKPLIHKLYNEGKGYQEIASRFCVSRQRIHQVIKNYKSGSSLCNEKINKRLSLYCAMCGKRPEVVHHDGTLFLSLCGKCHVLIHKREREKEGKKIICTVCKREFSMKYEISLSRIEYKCKSCRKYEKFGKGHIRFFEKEIYCVSCDKEFNKDNPYGAKNMCRGCYQTWKQRDRWANDSQYREEQKRRAYEWKEKNPKKMERNFKKSGFKISSSTQRTL